MGGGLDIDQGSNKGFNEEIKNYSNGEVGSHMFGESVQLQAPPRVVPEALPGHYGPIYRVI